MPAAPRQSQAVHDRVDVWLVWTDLPEPAVGSLETVLDDAQRARAAALRWPDDRRRRVVRHGAARHILAGYLGVAPREVRWRRGPHGRPEAVGGPAISLSSSGELAAVAVGPVGRPVGVDVQELTTRLDPARMAARLYPAAEAAYVAEADSLDRFVRLWVRKEACVKAAGGRLGPGLSLPVLDDLAPGPYTVTDLPAPSGFRAAVAVGGDGPYRTVVRHWPGVTIPAVDDVTAEMAAMLVAVTGEQEPIGAATRLEQDLLLESIEIAALAARVRDRWGVDLAAFYADLELDQIIGLTVGDLAGYVRTRVEG